MTARLEDLPANPMLEEEEMWEDEACDEEDAFATLVPVNDHQLVCAGLDLIDLFNYSEEIDEADDAYFARLGLTCTMEPDDFGDPEGFRSIAELSEESYYLLTFTPETDLSDFSMLNLLSVEEIPEQTYNDFVDAAGATPCDGNCDDCSQDCIGKQPIE